MAPLLRRLASDYFGDPVGSGWCDTSLERSLKDSALSTQQTVQFLAFYTPAQRSSGPPSAEHMATMDKLVSDMTAAGRSPGDRRVPAERHRRARPSFKRRFQRRAGRSGPA